MEIIKKGDKYNRLTAIRFDYKDKQSYQFWLFRCNCGNKKVIQVHSVKTGNTKSCGCLLKENWKKRTDIHRMRYTRTYKSWESMKQRCLNRNSPDYKNWGGRGIIICKEWINSFINFYRDMGDRPEGKSLDRINNEGNYCKENCRWATPKEQANNRRL